MSFEFYSKTKGYLKLSVHAWPKAMELAKLYGWKPKGTKKNYKLCIKFAEETGRPVGVVLDDIYSEFEGEYNTNKYQVVTGKDARNLATALELALDDIPDNLDIEKEHTCTPEETTAWLHQRGIIIHTVFKDGEQVRETEVMSMADLPQDFVYAVRQPGAMIIPINPHLDPFQYFGGPEKKLLKDFIDFCKGGSFFIA